uniref:Fatty acyl-CoA reductase n=1 Tax=Tetrastichus brontispae TaxID=2033808 RepID=A0A650FKR0_9HYME|nr:truncated FAR10 [Tetrastichus brontispae]
MSVVDAIYQRMRDDTEAVAEEATGESEVAKFYAGLSVLLTGATDLLGKCVLEKLLRDCSELDKVYVLVRVKRGQDFQDRCNKLFADSIFDTLRKQNVNFKNKIVPMKSDLSEDNLGLSDDDRKTLTSRAQIIFHNGSANPLDEQISVALKTNVLGTKRMLELARQCSRLKAFLFVSTAFSHCHERVVEEKFYRSPAELKTVEDMIVADEAPSGLTRDALKMLLGEWPNVFTFTKATAEELVQQHASRASYACCVFRPSLGRSPSPDDFL